MEKVSAFFEKYVEWIALTIGGLLFMYALWTFWIRPDVTVTVGAETVGPRNVDMAVRRGPGASLEAQINNPLIRVRTDVPDIPREFADKLAMAGFQASDMRMLGYYLGPNPIGRPDGTLPESFRVTAAPVPPPAEIRRLATGRSYSEIPEGGQQSLRDLAEVRVDFRIPAYAIAQAFREVRLPQVFQNTSLLRVQLMRQRLMADGSWGPEQEVALLGNNPLAGMPLPADDASLDAKQEYVTFVEANPQWLREPPFYVVHAGDDPMSLPVVKNAEEDPAPTTAPGQTRTNPNYQEDPRAAGRDAARPQDPAPQQPTPAPTGAQPNTPPPDAGRGAFNAATHQGTLTGFAWDVDADPGETYRYRVIYALRNPMFNTKGIAAAEKPELQTTLALFSSPEQTAWSPPITVEPLTYFFMTGAGAAQAKFTVFRWQNGKWQSQDFDALAGDPIGVTDPQGVDFRTGRTLVDVRTDPGTNENYALLVDSEGRFTRRSVKDTALPKLKQLQDEVKASSGVAAR